MISSFVKKRKSRPDAKGGRAGSGLDHARMKRLKGAVCLNAAWWNSVKLKPRPMLRLKQLKRSMGIAKLHFELGTEKAGYWELGNGQIPIFINKKNRMDDRWADKIFNTVLYRKDEIFNVPPDRERTMLIGQVDRRGRTFVVGKAEDCLLREVKEERDSAYILEVQGILTFLSVTTGRWDISLLRQTNFEEITACNEVS